MKKFTITLFASLITIMSFSCKSTKYTPTDFPDAQITFGSGGGFTGAVTNYTLLENGQLFKRSSLNKEFLALHKIKSDVVEQMFKNYEFLKIGEETINDPGNLYYFIQFKDKDKKEHKITWNDQSVVDEKVKSFYGILSAITKSED